MADAGSVGEARPLRERDPDLSFGVLQEVLGFHVTLAAIVTLGLFERHLGQPMGLRKAEYSLLMLLLANGPTPAKRLAQTLRLSAPQLTMMIDRLQDAHWLRRERNPVDRRSQFIVLTREGEALSRRAAATSKTMEQGLLQCLSPAERAMLIELLMKVAAYRQPQTADLEMG